METQLAIMKRRIVRTFPLNWTPAEMDTFARSEVATWGQVIRDNNTTMD
jgi:hypothetical protein